MGIYIDTLTHEQKLYIAKCMIKPQIPSSIHEDVDIVVEKNHYYATYTEESGKEYKILCGRMFDYGTYPNILVLNDEPPFDKIRNKVIQNMVDIYYREMESIFGKQYADDLKQYEETFNSSSESWEDEA